MIEPTVGRVVWFWEKGRVEGAQPCAAIVAHVWSDTCVNLAYFDGNGVGHSATSVPLVQDGGAPLPSGFFCEWMPYQKGQAAKTEALESKLSCYNGKAKDARIK